MRYPRGEIVWTGYYNKNHELKFIVTSKPLRDYYFLYEVVDAELKKLGKTRSPMELESKFNVMDVISG